MAIALNYLGWRVMKGKRGEEWLRKRGIGLSTIGGTSFQDTDLTEANFSRIRLFG